VIASRFQRITFGLRGNLRRQQSLRYSSYRVKTPSIAIFSGSHFCHNPRVIKEATTLAHAGYQVEVVGGWFEKDFKVRDQELLSRLAIRFTPILDLLENDRSKRFAVRLRRKLGELAHLRGGLENSWELGIFAPALRRAACGSNADLLIAHSEPAMAAVVDAGRRRGRSVGVDMEDWFSEDGTEEMRKRRPVRLLRSLEHFLLKTGTHRSCTSRAMSDALATEFRCEPPSVLYNAFAWSERQTLDGMIKDRRNPRVPSVHWYSQTLGKSRGLEDLFAALPFLEHEVEIHLRGRPIVGFDEWFTAKVPADWRSRFLVHGLVTNDELLSRIAEHDIGFAGDGRFCRSRDLTVSNKILQYLLAGLAVVASDTAGHREVAEQACGAVMIYESGDPRTLARQLNALLASAEKLRAAKAAALVAAEETFCWERQAPILLQSIEKALATRPSSSVRS
jgi:glycosyltransferase involved in cell wall biosynthesis